MILVLLAVATIAGTVRSIGGSRPVSGGRRAASPGGLAGGPERRSGRHDRSERLPATGRALAVRQRGRAEPPDGTLDGTR